MIRNSHNFFYSHSLLLMYNNCFEKLLVPYLNTNVKKYEKLDSFHYQCLNRSPGIFWPYVISLDELSQEMGSVQMSLKVRRKRQRFLTHVLRMLQQHHCVTALTWAPNGRRKMGRPKTTWRQSVEKERVEVGWK